MPVRSSNSSTLRWPDRESVDCAARDCASRQAARRADLLRVGYFGSYARGDAGIGSDLDLVIVVADSTPDVARRALEWDTTDLPVPADVLVYTAAEWSDLDPHRGREHAGLGSGVTARLRSGRRRGRDGTARAAPAPRA